MAVADIKTPIIHRRKLFGGRYTAMELHRKLAWGGHLCDGCGAKDVSLRVQVFVALSDMSLTTRMEIEFQISIGALKKVMTAGGHAIRTSIMHACPRCQPALERATARGPSYAMRDLDYGPGEDKAQVQVILPGG